MRNIGTLLVASAMVFAFGCDDSRDPAGTDAGGGIVLMDSGPGMTGTDGGGGMTGTDAGGGMMMGTCSITSQADALPPGCLPRCAAATLQALNMCPMDATAQQCQQDTTTADTTPAVTVTTPGMPIQLDCNGCFNWQIVSCVATSCPSEVQACVMCADQCNPNTAGCETEEMAINTCQMTNSMAIQACAQPRVGACFGT